MEGSSHDKQNNNEIDEIINRGRKITIQKKLGVRKEFIEEKDLESLIESMKLTINQEDVKNIFNKLDTDMTGKVSLETLLESVKNAQSSKDLNNLNENSYSYVFRSLNENLTTKSERIITKLKKLKEKAYFNCDKESQTEINWYNKSYVG